MNTHKERKDKKMKCNKCICQGKSLIRKANEWDYINGISTACPIHGKAGKTYRVTTEDAQQITEG